MASASLKTVASPYQLKPYITTPAIQASIEYGAAFPQIYFKVSANGAFCDSTSTAQGEKVYLVKYLGDCFQGVDEAFFGETLVNSTLFPTTAFTWFKKKLKTTGIEQAENTARLLNQQLANYKIDLQKNSTIEWGKVTHHPNIMYLNDIIKTIETESPLIALDVDFSLIYKARFYDSFLGEYYNRVDNTGKPLLEPTEPNFDFDSFCKDIKQKAPNAVFILLTNGRGTQKKFEKAELTLPEDITILEPRTDSDSQQQNQLTDLHKGKRLFDYLSLENKKFTEIHFLDDDYDFLTDVAKMMNTLSSLCSYHTYHYIRQYRQSCFQIARSNLPQFFEETEALQMLCKEDKRHVAPLAAQNLLSATLT